MPLQRRGGCRPARTRPSRNRAHADPKREIVERLTETMVGIEGENMREVTWVVVEKVRSGDSGIGGKALSTEDVKALAAGAAA
jgi:4-oxalocrotonate tautomerase